MHRILIVDDETTMLRGIEFHLQENSDYRISTAPDRETALELLENNEFDLVVSDLMLPDIADGLAIMKAAKEQWYRPGVLGMTAFETVENAVLTMQAGADDFIPKGFGLDELSLRIDNLLKQKRQVDRLALENRILRETIQQQFSDFRIIGESVLMKELVKKVRKVAADARTTCLIEGESGTGKDLIARAIHAVSRRHSAPFVPINCAAIPENLIESELFGHEKGAFTGAYTAKQGKFEDAHSGIIFLDEIGELPLNLQVRLLRVLEDRRIYRVGGKRPIEVDVMVLSATNSDLAEMVRNGRFREDLYFRLNVVNLLVPPLRERKEDVRPLAQFFLDKFNRDRNKNLEFSPQALSVLESYNFPGNVRELRNIVEDAFVFCEGNTIQPPNLKLRSVVARNAPADKAEAGDGSPVPAELKSLPYKKALEIFEREYLSHSLHQNFWNIHETARKAGVSRKWIYDRIKRLDIKQL